MPSKSQSSTNLDTPFSIISEFSFDDIIQEDWSSDGERGYLFVVRKSILDEPFNLFLNLGETTDFSEHGYVVSNFLCSTEMQMHWESSERKNVLIHDKLLYCNNQQPFPVIRKTSNKLQPSLSFPSLICLFRSNRRISRSLKSQMEQERRYVAKAWEKIAIN